MTHEIDIEKYKIIFSKPTILKSPYYMRRITLDKNIVNNEFIIQEGFQGFVLVEEKNASNDEKVNFYIIYIYI